MATVETVRGPVDVTALGRTLMHEHVFIAQQEMVANYNHAFGGDEPLWDEEQRVADGIAKLRRALDGGIRTLVDPTVPGLGRDVRRIARVNAEVDVNIVVAAGHYAFLELPNFLATRSDDQITGLWVREFREGIDDTGIRPAFLKCAVEHHGIVGDVPRILACIGAAAVETGAPVMVHTSAPARMGIPALETLTGHGVAPEKIVVAHAGDSNDMEYLRALADTGAWLGLDRFNIPHFNPDTDRVATLVALLEAGYGPQLHLGHDAACFYDFMHENPPFADERPDYLHLSEHVVPRMREAGVTDEHLELLFVDNPRRFFS